MKKKNIGYASDQKAIPEMEKERKIKWKKNKMNYGKIWLNME